MELTKISEIYVTKYWLTRGIFVYKDCDVDDKGNAWTPRGTYPSHFIKSEWCKSPEEAHRAIEILREKKIESLEKAIRKARTIAIKFVSRATTEEVK
jgi:hypothetical protein